MAYTSTKEQVDGLLRLGEGTLSLHLTAWDLRGFEPVAGPSGLQLTHPAELVVRVATRDVDAAREFVSELELALAERALRAAEDRPALPDGTDQKSSQ